MIHWELCKKLKFDPTNKWYMRILKSVQENETHKLLWDFETQTDHLILARRPDLVIIYKKENLPNSELCRPVRPQSIYKKKVKREISTETLLDNKKIINKLWNMRVTVIRIIIGVLGTISKGLVKGMEDVEIRGQVEVIQTTALLRTARILRRVQKTCSHSKSSERLSANAGVKNIQGVK